MKLLLNKSIAVFGSGAVGCYIGRFFVEAGFNVDFISRGKRFDYLKDNGLSVFVGDKKECQLSINVKDKLSKKYDIILLCVKSFDTINVASLLKDSLTDTGFVVSIQNGVDNSYNLRSILGVDKVVPTVVYLTAQIRKDGALSYVSRGRMFYGYYDESGKSISETFGEVLSLTKINYKFHNNIKEVQWKKLSLNAMMNPLSALFNMNFGKMLSNKEVMELSYNLFKEAQKAAETEGVIIDDNEYDEIIKKCGIDKSFKTSMLQDVESGKKIEVDAILGAIIKRYEKIGQVAYYSDMLLKIMNIKFGSWYHISPRLASDVLVVKGDEVLLIERLNEPYGWAIPGGFVDLYETMEKAAVRELEEETGIVADINNIELLGIYSDPKRDSRGHTVSAIYVYFGGGNPVAADDAKSAKYFHIDNLPDNLAFDHKDILQDFIKKYRK